MSAEYLPSYAHLDSHHISLLLDTQIDALSNPWKGSIKFKCFIFSGDEEEIPLLLSGSSSDVDICDYLGGQRYPARRLYFDPKTVPPPQGKKSLSHHDHEDDIEIWSELKRKVFSAGHE